MLRLNKISGPDFKRSKIYPFNLYENILHIPTLTLRLRFFVLCFLFKTKAQTVIF